MWQFCFVKALPNINLFKWIHPFVLKQVVLLFVFCKLWGVALKLLRGMFSPANPMRLAKSASCQWSAGPAVKNWCNFAYCLEYTLSSCLLTSKETGDVHRIPWGCGKRLGWGLAPALYASLCCKRFTLLPGISLPSGRGPSSRLCSFWQPAATGSTTIFSAAF